jgi:hypothetical protein
MDDVADLPGQITNRQVFTGSDVDVLRLAVAVFQEQTGANQVADVKEFAAWRARPPIVTSSTPAILASWNLRINAGST